MTNGVFSSLTVTGNRTDLTGMDGAGNHWIRVGPNEPGDCAWGINAQARIVIFNAGWVPQVSGARTDLVGADGAGFHWIRIGASEPADCAIGLNGQARTVAINAGWTMELNGPLKFADGSVQGSAATQGATGPRGNQGPQGPQGPQGTGLNAKVVAGTDANNAGGFRVLGASNTPIVAMGADPSFPNAGVVGVLAPGASTLAAELYVDGNGNGVLAAQVKNFRITHPTKPDHEIVYASLEGPEVAAYVRGTGTLSLGRCTVELPEHFSSVVSLGLTVQITPLSATSLGLAITAKSAEKFVVEELNSGKGSYDFDWEIKGTSETRMEGNRSNKPMVPTAPFHPLVARFTHCGGTSARRWASKNEGSRISLSGRDR